MRLELRALEQRCREALQGTQLPFTRVLTLLRDSRGSVTLEAPPDVAQSQGRGEQEAAAVSQGQAASSRTPQEEESAGPPPALMQLLHDATWNVSGETGDGARDGGGVGGGRRGLVLEADDGVVHADPLVLAGLSPAAALLLLSPVELQASTLRISSPRARVGRRALLLLVQALYQGWARAGPPLLASSPPAVLAQMLRAALRLALPAPVTCALEAALTRQLSVGSVADALRTAVELQGATLPHAPCSQRSLRMGRLLSKALEFTALHRIQVAQTREWQLLAPEVKRLVSEYALSRGSRSALMKRLHGCS